MGGCCASPGAITACMLLRPVAASAFPVLLHYEQEDDTANRAEGGVLPRKLMM